MPKITDQAIPPELLAIYTRLVSPGSVTQGADGTLRLKKRKRAPKKPPRNNLDLIAFKRTAAIVARELGLAEDSAEAKALIYEIVQSLIVGVVPPEYFQRMRRNSAVTLESYATSVPDPAPPAYAMRDPSNLPTLPTYPDGSATAQPPGYSGASSSGYFEDTYLRWRKLEFMSPNIAAADAVDRVVILWDARIDASASTRGVRPMYSLNIKARRCFTNGSDLGSTAPPLQKISTFYWRFKLPPTAPPYYNSYQTRRVCKALSRICKDSGTGSPLSYLINASVRPMRGRSFNNNHYIATTVTGDPELWEIKQCIGKDADTWAATDPAGINGWSSICWSPELELFCAVAWGAGPYHIMTSPDGIVWSARVGPDPGEWHFVTWVPELSLFVALRQYDARGGAMTSPDGINWTVRAAPTDYAWSTAAWSPSLGLLVALSNDRYEHAAMTSPDGINWTLNTSIPAAYWQGIAWSDNLGMFAAVSADDFGPYVMTSTDGMTWTAATADPGYYYNCITWSPELGLFVALGSISIQTDILISADGINWTNYTVPFTANWMGLTWASELGLFCAVGGQADNNNLMTSPDGITWTLHESPSAAPFKSVAWAPQLCRFAAVAYGSTSKRAIYSGE